jgi:outer membrane lipoprotein-sorting protein
MISPLLIASALISHAVSCAQPESRSMPAVHLTADEILSRSGAAHAGAAHLWARGLFRDHRRGRNRRVPIEWILARPGRCRLQIDRDVAIIVGDQWWSYREEVGRFIGHRTFTKTPIETAAFLLSDHAPLLLPSLFLPGAAAFEGPGLPWKLQGVAWEAGRPCYVFARTLATADAAPTLRIWIDQDSLLLRSWTLGRTREDGTEGIFLEVTYYDLVANGPLAADAFQLTEPARIELPSAAAADATP